MTAITGTLRASLADAIANRGSFWFQVTLMVVNDGTWILFWVLFFHQVGTLRGWQTQDVIVLFSILLPDTFPTGTNMPCLTMDVCLPET